MFTLHPLRLHCLPREAFFVSVTLNPSECRVPLVEMDLRPTNPNYLTDEELVAIAAGVDRTNEASNG
jgi:hypothetical protein